jgi:uncharacterized protein (DUF433 family)
MSRALTVDVPLVADERGNLHVMDTRLPLELIINDYRRGNGAERIASNYAGLSLSAVYSVLAYYHANRAELDVYVDEKNRQLKNLHEQIEHDFPAQIMREEIKRRRDAAR